MNKKEINNLKSLLKELDNKYNINTGGCIYVAYLIVKSLTNLNIPYTVIDWKDSNGEVFHTSVVIDGIDINPAYPEFNGIPEKSHYQTPYSLMRLNAKYEDFNKFYKRSYKSVVHSSISEFFGKEVKS